MTRRCPGRPPVYDHDDVILLVKTVTEPPPDPATRWTMDLLAARMAEHGVPISASQAWRICKALDLKPWQTESWMTSHDPDFWAKAGDVCGLYLNPPENAVVWSVDEKSQIQAKSRVNPTRPAVPGARRRRDDGYVRHGTAVLFAGLNVHDGTVAGWVTDSTRGTNFVEFLTDLVAQTPRHLELHCIVDNFSAHGTPAVEKFLDTHPRVSCTTPRRTHRGSTSRAVLLDPGATRSQTRRVRLRRRTHHSDPRIHQRLQPPRTTIPMDLRRPTTRSRVTHNDLRESTRSVFNGVRLPSSQALSNAASPSACLSEPRTRLWRERSDAGTGAWISSRRQAAPAIKRTPHSSLQSARLRLPNASSADATPPWLPTRSHTSSAPAHCASDSTHAPRAGSDSAELGERGRDAFLVPDSAVVVEALGQEAARFVVLAAHVREQPSEIKRERDGHRLARGASDVLGFRQCSVGGLEIVLVDQDPTELCQRGCGMEWVASVLGPFGATLERHLSRVVLTRCPLAAPE